MPPKGIGSRRGKKKKGDEVVDAASVSGRVVEIEAAVDDREDDEHGDPTANKQYDWKEGHQEAMADFWKDHPEFYDKSDARYKDNQKKKAAVETFLVDMQNIFEEIKKPLPTCECIFKLH